MSPGEGDDSVFRTGFLDWVGGESDVFVWNLERKVIKKEAKKLNRTKLLTWNKTPVIVPVVNAKAADKAISSE
jgi:hypothetical protein